MTAKADRRTVEFGDFQTPQHLANAVCDLVVRKGFAPASVIEPSCGRGAFLTAALKAFPSATVHGYDCNSAHVEAARHRMSACPRASVSNGDFFQRNWDAVLAELADPVLVLGNPPWVTNAAIGSLGGANLPKKSNVDGLRGMEALTGSANFDISEWMIRENVRWLRDRGGAIAVLCKTSVARKVLARVWAEDVSIECAAIHGIDSARDFGVSVDACLLFVRVAPLNGGVCECDGYASLDAAERSSRFGMKDGVLVSDLTAYERLAFLHATGMVGWRSGLKHDCSRIFEFSSMNGDFVNGLGEKVSIETSAMFPLLKSSDVAGERPPRKRVLVPHRSMAESPLDLRRRAPNAWRYLVSHQEAVARRASQIYEKRPPFSIFGIGPYSFSPWKVAIAGLYKELRFIKISPIEGQPVLLDDTCYFYPCETEDECNLLLYMVSSPPALEFWSSLVFWDAKRPITARLLNHLDLAALARHLGVWDNPISKQLAAKQTGQSSHFGQLALL